MALTIAKGNNCSYNVIEWACNFLNPSELWEIKPQFLNSLILSDKERRPKGAGLCGEKDVKIKEENSIFNEKVDV